MQRREMLLKTGAAVLGLSAFPLGWARADDKKKPKILYFTKSSGYVHSVVKREGNAPAFSERLLADLGARHGFDVECSQDAAVFDGDLGRYDLFAFYTSGSGSDHLSVAQRDKLLKAIAAGKPFVGIHSATGTFRGKGVDPYIAMIGAEFLGHGKQQEARMKVASPKFPGAEKLGAGFKMLDEWYSQQKFAQDLHVILIQETANMQGDAYKRPPFPATWARMHEKGRVFYTSMGHREDVWTSDTFQQVLLGGMSWALSRIDADVTPNIDRVTPKAREFSQEIKPKAKAPKSGEKQGQ
jgi:uncharacterized protein